MDGKTWDVIVVGGASAGLSAALMLVRARRRVLVLDGGAPRNAVAPHMHGVLGHDGRSPLDLVADGRREVEGYGGVLRAARVTSIDAEGAGGTSFVVATEDGSRERTRRVVAATGLRDELPDIPGMAEQWGRGVVVCPYCDGYESRDARIAVIGTSPMSVHQAQLLRQWSADVTYFPNGVGAPDDGAVRAFDARRIRVDHRAVTGVVGGAGALVGIGTGDGATVPVDRVFTGPVPKPNDGLLRRLGVDLVEGGMTDGWVAVDVNGATSVRGVWAVGNVVDPRANVPVSMGQGAFAGGAVNADLIEEDTALAIEGETMSS